MLFRLVQYMPRQIKIYTLKYWTKVWPAKFDLCPLFHLCYWLVACDARLPIVLVLSFTGQEKGHKHKEYPVSFQTRSIFFLPNAHHHRWQHEKSGPWTIQQTRKERKHERLLGLVNKHRK